MKVLSMLLALAVSLVIVGNLSAAEEKTGRERHDGDRAGAGPFGMLNRLNLTDDQKVKVEEIEKEYAPKFKEAMKNLESILTPEQKKARDEAFKAAHEAGKNRQETRKAVEEAVKLTDEQKAKQADARKAMAALTKEVIDKVKPILNVRAARTVGKDSQTPSLGFLKANNAGIGPKKQSLPNRARCSH